jgi:hypothetical protein
VDKEGNSVKVDKVVKAGKGDKAGKALENLKLCSAGTLKPQRDACTRKHVSSPTDLKTSGLLVIKYLYSSKT